MSSRDSAKIKSLMGRVGALERQVGLQIAAAMHADDISDGGSIISGVMHCGRRVAIVKHFPMLPAGLVFASIRPGLMEVADPLAWMRLLTDGGLPERADKQARVGDLMIANSAFPTVSAAVMHVAVAGRFPSVLRVMDAGIFFHFDESTDDEASVAGIMRVVDGVSDLVGGKPAARVELFRFGPEFRQNKKETGGRLAPALEAFIMDSVDPGKAANIGARWSRLSDEQRQLVRDRLVIGDDLWFGYTDVRAWDAVHESRPKHQ